MFEDFKRDGGGGEGKRHLSQREGPLTEEEGGMKGEQSAGVGTPKLEYVEKGIKWRERKKRGGGGGVER